MKFTKPTLITITAPTCSGKSVLLEALTNDYCSRIVSTTTRARRSGEQEGVDYFFISEGQSKAMEANGEFAELITFRGNRYGVTNAEMAAKMNSDKPPVVILEPQGLAVYEAFCAKNNWGIFKIYVHALEPVRLKRLVARTTGDVMELMGDAAYDSLAHRTNVVDVMKIISQHTDRVLSITGDERNWHQQRLWDVTVPGDDLAKAIELIKYGIQTKNKLVQNSENLGW